VSDKDIAYDVRLEEELEKIKLQIWLNEELQLQPKEYHLMILKNVT
jgi:hypothetical protein